MKKKYNYSSRQFHSDDDGNNNQNDQYNSNGNKDTLSMRTCAIFCVPKLWNSFGGVFLRDVNVIGNCVDHRSLSINHRANILTQLKIRKVSKFSSFFFLASSFSFCFVAFQLPPLSLAFHFEDHRALYYTLQSFDLLDCPEEHEEELLTKKKKYRRKKQMRFMCCFSFSFIFFCFMVFSLCTCC
jgi:hypothetical protein